MCTIRLIVLTVAQQNFKPVSCKMHAFLHCYTAILYEPISKLYLYKNSAVYLSDVGATVCFFFFLQGTGIEKPDYR